MDVGVSTLAMEYTPYIWPFILSLFATTSLGIYALRHRGRDYYPKYALGPDFRPLPVIKEILAVLSGYDPELLAGWFDSTSRFLRGRRPRELVATEPAKVLAAARNMIEVQVHHG